MVKNGAVALAAAGEKPAMPSWILAEDSTAAAVWDDVATGFGLEETYKVKVTGVEPSFLVGLSTTSVLSVDTTTPSGTATPSTCAFADSSSVCASGAAPNTNDGAKSRVKRIPYFMIKSYHVLF